MARAEADSMPSERDERLGEAIEEYLALAESGDAPDPDAFAGRHPDLSDELKEALEGLALVQGLVGGTQMAESLEPGRRIAGYRIVRELGRGGMGVVYEAVHVDLDRPVALKVLGRVAPDPDGPQRFLNEARTAAALHHTHIVPVFDVGRAGRLYYYAMQRIEGSGLDRVIRRLRRAQAAGVPDRSGSWWSMSRWRTGMSGPLSTARSGAEPVEAPSLADLTASWAGGASATARPRRPGAAARPRGHVRAADRLGLRPLGGNRGRPGGRRPGLRAPPGRRPPRRQALEPARRRPRHRLGGRLRPGAAGPRAGRLEGRARGHAPLHEPRAGRRRRARLPHRRLQPGRHALRAAHAPPALRRRHRRRARPPDPLQGADPAATPAPTAPRPGGDRPQGAGQAPRRPLRERRGDGRRPAPLPRHRAGARAADRPRRPLPPPGAAAPGGHDDLGRGRGRGAGRRLVGAPERDPPAERGAPRHPRAAGGARPPALARRGLHPPLRPARSPPRRPGPDQGGRRPDRRRGAAAPAPRRGRRHARAPRRRAEAGARDRAALRPGVPARPERRAAPGRRRRPGRRGRAVADRRRRGHAPPRRAARLRGPLPPRRARGAPPRRADARGGGSVGGRHPTRRPRRPPALGPHGRPARRPGDARPARRGRPRHARRPPPDHPRARRRHDARRRPPRPRRPRPGGLRIARRAVLWDPERPAVEPITLLEPGERPASTPDGNVPLFRIPLVAVAPDGRTIAAAWLWDDAIRFFDATTGAETARLEELPASVTALALGPDGLLAAALADGSVRLWEGQAQAPLPGFYHNQPGVKALHFSPDGTLLAVAGVGVELWDVGSNKQVAALTTPDGPVGDLDFSPDGALLAAATGERTALWAIAEPVGRARLAGFTFKPQSLAFVPSGALAMAEMNAPARLWGPGPGAARPLTELRPAALATDAQGRLLAFDADGLTLVGAAAAAQRVAFPAPPGAGRRELAAPVPLLGGAVVAVAPAASLARPAGFDPRRFFFLPLARSADGSTVVVARWGELYLWRAGEPDRLRRILPPGSSLAARDEDDPPPGRDGFGPGPGPGRGAGPPGRGRGGRDSFRGWAALALAPDGRVLYLVERHEPPGRDGVLRAWDLDPPPGAGPLVAREHPLSSPPQGLVALAASPDGRTLAVASALGPVLLLDAATGRALAAAPAAEDGARALALSFAPDGRTLAVGDQLGRVGLFATGAGGLSLRVILPGHLGTVGPLAFDADGRRLASTGDDRVVQLWDLARVGRELEALGLGW